MPKDEGPLSRAVLRRLLVRPEDVDFKGLDKHGRQVCGSVRLRKPEEFAAFMKAQGICPLVASVGLRTWLLRWEKWALAAAAGNLLLGLLTGWLVAWACGYGRSVSPSPGEAGAAILTAVFLVAIYLLVWLLVLLVQWALRRSARDMGQRLSSPSLKLAICLQLLMLGSVMLLFFLAAS